jgi:fatty acid desaturase
MLCKYKDALGKPKTGIHSYRIFNIAIFDVVLTFVLAYFTKGKFNYWYVLLFWFILGIILHRLFCVNTTIGQIIFGKSGLGLFKRLK